jgi:hypothetical protein
MYVFRVPNLLASHITREIFFRRSDGYTKRISNYFTHLLTACHLTQHITLAPSAAVASSMFIVQGRSNIPIENTIVYYRAGFQW